MRLKIVILLGVCVLLASCESKAPAPRQDTIAFSETDLEQGRYLAALGNCSACHTAGEAASLGGGVAFPVVGGLFDSPVGTVYSANISSDRETGIGAWSFDDFTLAMRDGVSKDGSYLYPVFPYTHFRALNNQDLFALYAFLKSSKPVRYTPPEDELPFPLSVRSLLVVWKFLVADREPFRYDANRSETWNRGAYLVLGVGHCGACHTPRNILLGEKTGQLLGGGVLYDRVADDKVRRWSAVNLTPAKAGLKAWSTADIERYLRTGHSTRAGVFGPMNDVVAGGTRYLTSGDAAAIAEFLKSLTPLEEKAYTPPPLDLRQAGQDIYRTHCAECHRDSGLGGFLKAPPLVGSAIVQSADPSSLINVVLYGAHVDPALPAPFGAWESMKGFGQKLDDPQVAALASFLRSEWGHEASRVDPEEVARQR